MSTSVTVHTTSDDTRAGHDLRDTVSGTSQTYWTVHVSDPVGTLSTENAEVVEGRSGGR